jgi:hypothetical protein
MAEREIDWLSRPGSELLARWLEEFWRDRGVEVHAWTERGWTWRSRDYFAVRSDIRLELPVRETKVASD